MLLKGIFSSAKDGRSTNRLQQRPIHRLHQSPGSFLCSLTISTSYFEQTYTVFSHEGQRL